MEEGIMTLTGQLARIDDELRRAYDGDCWHGPPLRQVLTGVTARAAAARHPQFAHTIWALVSHVAAWVEVVALRIAEWRPIETPDAGDFPPVADTTEAAWAAALEDLERRHGELLRVVGSLEASRLDETVQGKECPVAVMLHGTAQHYAYHAGQIALLKRLLG
jgi:DinB superfamily